MCKLREGLANVGSKHVCASSCQLRFHFKPILCDMQSFCPCRWSKDKETGRFKGIAFITFPSIDMAESAVRNLNQVRRAPKPTLE